jgi:hypothetical protein
MNQYLRWAKRTGFKPTALTSETQRIRKQPHSRGSGAAAILQPLGLVATER